MTTEESEQLAQDAEQNINIRATMHTLCGQIEGMAHHKWVGWWRQKAVELGLSGQREVYGDERRDLLERLQHYMATTPPEKRCRYGKGWCCSRPSNTWGHATQSPLSFARRASLRRLRRGSGCWNASAWTSRNASSGRRWPHRGSKRCGERRTLHTSPPASESGLKQPCLRNFCMGTMVKFHTIDFILSLFHVTSP